MSEYKFKTTNIHGRSYVQVHERIKFFRQEEQYKNWAIKTDFPMLTADEALCRCTITDRDGAVIAVGHAHELKSGSHINKTSFVENCETSAVGRALGMLGIGIDESVASANEVELAIAQDQAASKPAPKKPAPKKPAPKKPAPEKETPKDMEIIWDGAIQYIKGATDKRQAYDKTMQKYGDRFTDKQKEGLLKFVG
jgi:hypothetical protein